jgi:hypothetical protein
MGDTTADDRVVITLADLAHGIVLAEAPDQLELLAAVTARWDAGAVFTRKRSGSLGGSVGSGIEPTILVDLVYPLLTGTLAQVLRSGIVAGWRRRKWWRRRQIVQPTPQTVVMLSATQVKDVRAVCPIHAMALGCPEGKANALADAMYGVLCQAMAGSAEVSDDDS